jgi:hypothetical protein
MSDDVVRKTAFAAPVGVSRPACRNGCAPGRSAPTPLVGTGHCARIRIDVAKAQLRQRLDPVVRLGANGRARVEDEKGLESKPFPDGAARRPSPTRVEQGIKVTQR